MPKGMDYRPVHGKFPDIKSNENRSMRNRWISTLTFVLFLCASLPIQAATVASDGDEVPELAAFDQAMIDVMNANDIPDGQLAITWQGRLVYSRAFTNNSASPADVYTRFRIASVSKPMTSTLIHRAHQDGLLNVEDTIDQYLDLSTINGSGIDSRIATITIRDLLEHVAGFGAPSDYGYDPVFNDAFVAAQTGEGYPVLHSQILSVMNVQPLFNDPGTFYAYSNYGYMLAGMVLEAATGLPYHAYADSVLNPIGIYNARLARSQAQRRYSNEALYDSGRSMVTTVLDNSGDQVPVEYGGLNAENMAAFGGWVASATELVRWLSKLDDPDATDALLNTDTQALMFGRPQNYPEPYVLGNGYYGSGWAVRDYGNGERNTWHDGSLPSTSAYAVRVRDGFNYAVLFNKRNEQAPGSIQAQIDTAIGVARNQISTWPAGDQFPSLLMPEPEPAGARYSGSLYDITHNGEGFAVQVINATTAVIYWFTYDRDGKQRWYFGIGTLSGSRMIVNELLTARGGKFGPDFDPADVEFTTVGSLVINYYDDGSAKADYLLGADSGYMELSRLSKPFDNDDPETAGDWRNGLWFDISHDGEGFVLEVLPDGRILVYWFTYTNSGQPAWMIGTVKGPLLEDGADLPMDKPEGGNFGVGFDPDLVNVIANGLATFTIICGGPSTVVFSGGGIQFPDVTLNIDRLATYMQPPCE